MRIVISIALAAALGCGSKSSDQGGGDQPQGQSFAEGLKLACDAPDAIPDGKPGDRIMAAMKQVDPKITNKEVRDLLGSFASGGTGDKASLLRTAIQKARLNHCTLLELFHQLQTPAP